MGKIPGRFDTEKMVPVLLDVRHETEAGLLRALATENEAREAVLLTGT